MKKIMFILLLSLTVITSAISPANAATRNVFVKNSSAQHKVALTFDDGPHPRQTPAILAVLREYGIKATFFVIGKNVENYPEAFRQVMESGCEIGNHTYTHHNVGNMSDGNIADELEKTERAVMRFGYLGMSLFRPPEGNCGVPLERVSMQRGYDVVLWSIDTLDWAHTSASDIAKKVLNNIGDGDIILMHDYISYGGHTEEALKIIIPQLLAEGYEFVTVSELIGEE